MDPCNQGPRKLGLGFAARAMSVQVLNLQFGKYNG